MIIDEDYSKSIKDQILSFNQRKQPSLISIGVIPSTHNDIIVALDSNGILNAYNITNESLSNGNNDTYLEAIQSNNNNYIYPNASFYFNDSNYLQGIFTSMEIENNTVYITGNFQTISLSSKEILEGVQNKNNSKIPLIPINCTSLTQYEDFNVNERRMIGCDIKDNHLLSYSDEGRLFLFDINSKKPISSTHINGYKMNIQMCSNYGSYIKNYFIKAHEIGSGKDFHHFCSPRNCLWRNGIKAIDSPTQRDIYYKFDNGMFEFMIPPYNPLVTGHARKIDETTLKCESNDGKRTFIFHYDGALTPSCLNYIEMYRNDKGDMVSYHKS